MSQDGRRISCQGCGAVLDEEIDRQPRPPCPHCGDTRCQVHIFLNDRVAASERAVAHGLPTNSSGEHVGIAGPGSRSATADFSSPGWVSYDIAGDAPHHEEGALETARILVQKLRGSGVDWSQPTMVDTADVDCETLNGGDTLSMQVTRVPGSSGLWRNLGRDSTASGAGPADDLADELMNAIGSKASRLPSAQRARLALVLDARDTPAFALARVAARFSELHGNGAVNLGFRSIWVVGPTVQLVWQLA
jgi:hypothetical protein